MILYNKPIKAQRSVKTDNTRAGLNASDKILLLERLNDAAEVMNESDVDKKAKLETDFRLNHNASSHSAMYQGNPSYKAQVDHEAKTLKKKSGQIRYPIHDLRREGVQNPNNMLWAGVLTNPELTKQKANTNLELISNFLPIPLLETMPGVKNLVKAGKNSTIHITPEQEKTIAKAYKEYFDATNSIENKRIIKKYKEITDDKYHRLQTNNFNTEFSNVYQGTNSIPNNIYLEKRPGSKGARHYSPELLELLKTNKKWATRENIATKSMIKNNILLNPASVNLNNYKDVYSVISHELGHAKLLANSMIPEKEKFIYKMLFKEPTTGSMLQHQKYIMNPTEIRSFIGINLRDELVHKGLLKNRFDILTTETLNKALADKKSILNRQHYDKAIKNVDHFTFMFNSMPY